MTLEIIFRAYLHRIIYRVLLLMSVEISISIIGLISGFLSGMFGIGGGMIVTPLLILIYPMLTNQNLSIIAITGLSSAQGFFSSAVSFFFHRKTSPINKKLILTFAIPMATSNLIASYLSPNVDAKYILFIFGLLGFASLFITFFIKKPPVFFNKYSKTLIPLIGLVIGILCGIIGQGGGFIYLPILIYLFGLDIKSAIATSAAIGIIAAMGALFGRINTISIFLNYLPYLIIGIFIGSYFGSKISKSFSPENLKISVNLFILICSIALIIKSIKL